MQNLEVHEIESSSIPTNPQPNPGAQWVRVALQVNSFHYHGHPSPSEKYNSEQEYNKELLDRCEELSIRILAVTDHWQHVGARQLIDDASARRIIVLPGFEAKSSEGIHILAIFPADTNLEAIPSFIGACGGNTQNPQKLSDKHFIDIASKIGELGGLAVPAHANVNSGLLSQVRGNAQSELVKTRHIDCIGISPERDPAKDQDLVLRNKKPYTRDTQLTVLYADDISHPDDLEKRGGTTWFKLDSLSLNAIKHALRTPETRILLSDPTASPRSTIHSISWNGGYLDGQTIPFSDDLTTLIGGRGAGKTTVIESLRFVLELPAQSEHFEAEHDQIVQNVLGQRATVTLTAFSATPQRALYRITRTVGDAASQVHDFEDNEISLRPIDVLPDVDIFGQHELANLAHSKSQVADMLVRMFEPEVHRSTPPALEEALLIANSTLTKAENALESIASEVGEIARIDSQIEQYGGTETAGLLAAKTAHDAKGMIYSAAKDKLGLARTTLGSILTDKNIHTLQRNKSDGEADEPDLEAIESVLEAFHMDIERAISNLQSSADHAVTQIEQLKNSWQDRTKEEVAAHLSAIQALSAAGSAPDDYLRLIEKRRVLEAKKLAFVDAGEAKSKAEDERTRALENLRDSRQEMDMRIKRAAGAANTIQPRMVRVVPVLQDERTDYHQVAISFITGNRASLTRYIDSKEFDPPTFVLAARSGVEKLQAIGLTESLSSRVVGAGNEFLRAFEEVRQRMVVEVSLNVSEPDAPPVFRNIGELSKGQLATAFLLLMLGKDRGVIVIDQPEDDLDNRFIYLGVVSRLRELKMLRQVIVSTHNANIPVLGDAELVVALQGTGSHGSVVSDGVGSLDVPGIKYHTEEILEGGREAFKKRHRIYGF